MTDNMHVSLDDGMTSEFYSRFYHNQRGAGDGYYSGRTIMTGRGLGGMFSKLVRNVAPTLVKAGKRALRAALDDDKESVSSPKRRRTQPRKSKRKTKTRRKGQNVIL